MNVELEIVNVKCEGEIPVENINLELITEDLEFNSKDDKKNGCDIVFENGGLTLYDSGKYIIRANSECRLRKTQADFVQVLSQAGFEYDIEDLDFSVDSVVGWSQLNRSIDLNKLILAYGPQEVSYEDDWPGLMYEGYPISIVVYNNGKIILFGNSRKQVENIFYNDVLPDIKKFSDQVGL